MLNKYNHWVHLRLEKIEWNYVICNRAIRMTQQFIHLLSNNLFSNLSWLMTFRETDLCEDLVCIDHLGLWCCTHRPWDEVFKPHVNSRLNGSSCWHHCTLECDWNKSVQKGHGDYESVEVDKNWTFHLMIIVHRIDKKFHGPIIYADSSKSFNKNRNNAWHNDAHSLITNLIFR